MQTPSFEEFNTMLAVVTDENGGSMQTCIRLPYDDILIYNQAPSGLFDDMRKNYPHADNLPTETDKYHDWTRVVRIVNGRALFGEIRRDECGTVATHQRKYFYQLMRHLVENHEPQTIGLMSREGIINMVELARNIKDDGELRSFVDLFDISKINMTFIHNECGFEDSCVVITQNLLDAGLTHYYEHYYEDVNHYIRDEFLVKQLQVGDAIIVRKRPDGTIWHTMFIKEEFELLYQIKDCS